MAMDASGVTNPAAGVIATSPTTAAIAAPTPVGLPLNAISIRTHVTTAAAAERFVVTNAKLARPPAVKAEPALKPNQPNHSSDAPRMTKGTLCGVLFSACAASRGPRTIAATSAETPALMCTTDPPAKSIAPNCLSQPPTPHTQCAIGL